MARVTLRITGTQLLCQDEHPSLLAALESHQTSKSSLVRTSPSLRSSSHLRTIA